ncbi:MAG: hypothetical protein AAFV78_17060 [Bacteroidota bacterium]
MSIGIAYLELCVAIKLRSTSLSQSPTNHAANVSDILTSNSQGK